MELKEQTRIASAFEEKGFIRNPELSTSRYITLEDDEYSVYINRLGELAWESKGANQVGAKKIFNPIWRVVGA